MTPFWDTHRGKSYLEAVKYNISTSKCVVNVVDGLTQTNFRPKNFSEYIGQARVKERIEYYVKGTKDRNRIFPHTLIHGSAGMGKTTLAQILANILGVTFIETIASNLEDIETIQNKIQLTDGGILFLDEIHSLPRNMAEKFYPIMEDFRYENVNIKPFTLVGATTEFGEMLQDRKPFVDRFKNIIELEDYTIGDLVTIGKQYKDREFRRDIVEISQLMLIAENCRETPRNLLRLLEATIYFRGNTRKVLDNFGIIRQGFTKKDVKILEYLVSNKVCGLQTIANYLDTSVKNYIFEIEPYLLKKDIIMRTSRGRKITDKGLFVLEQLKKEL